MGLSERIEIPVGIADRVGRHKRAAGEQGEKVGDLWLLRVGGDDIVPTPVEIGRLD